MKLKTVGALGVIATCIVIFSSSASAAPYDPNKIIDDAIFDNTSTMSINSINSFLNQFPTSCISPNVGFSAPDPTGYNPTNGFLYGGNVSAGQVIFDASQAYGLNPQVLLTTLQKEQSLVTGSAGCSTLQYAAAVGYGCPDGGTTYSYTGTNLYTLNGTTVTSVSGTCVDSALKVGFSQQIIHAAWLLKFGEQRSKGSMNWAVIQGNWNNSDDPQSCYDGPMTQGTYQICPSGPTSYYDGYTTIDDTAVHMDDGATAALYWYTPHFAGNQNFINIYTSWFGTTFASILIKGSGPTVYLQADDINTAYPIPSGDVLSIYGLANSAVTNVTDAYISSLDTSTMLTSLFMKAGDPTIYLGDAGHAYGIASNTYCVKWNLSCNQSNLIATLPAGIIKNITFGPVLGDLMVNNGTTYYMDSGTRHPFLSASDISLSPWSSEQANLIISPLNSRQQADTPELYSNHFFRISNNGSIYYYASSSSQYFTFSSFDNFKNWWDQSSILNDDYSSFNSTPPTATVLPDFAVDSGTTFALAGLTKIALVSPASVSSVNTSTTPGISNLVHNKATTNITSSQAVRLPDGTIGLVSNGHILPFPTLLDVSLMVGSNVLNVPASLATAYPLGQLAIPSGRVIKPVGGQAIYLYGSDNNLWAIGNGQQVNAALQWIDNVLTPSISDVNYGNVNSYVGTVSIGGIYYAVQPNGTVRQLIASTLNSKASNLSAPIVSPIASKAPIDSRSYQFIHFDDGAIFAVQGSAICPIASYGTYSSMGGTTSNTLEMSIGALPMFSTGPQI